MASVVTPIAPITIGTNPRPSLPTTEKRTPEMVLSAIQSWEYWSEIESVVGKEYQMPKEEFATFLPEYQKFLGLIFLGHSPIGMFSRKIDEIWHSHVLSMHLYNHFCLGMHGEMIYHVPQVPKYDAGAICTTCKSCTDCSGGGQGGGKGSHNAYPYDSNSGEAFFLSYTKAYGPVPRHIWNLPLAEGLCGTM